MAQQDGLAAPSGQSGSAYATLLQQQSTAIPGGGYGDGGSNNEPQNDFNAQAAFVHHNTANSRPLILITDSNSPRSPTRAHAEQPNPASRHKQVHQVNASNSNQQQPNELESEEDERVEVVDGIKYRIVAAVTRPPTGSSGGKFASNPRRNLNNNSRTANPNQQQNHTGRQNENSTILEQENENSEPIETPKTNSLIGEQTGDLDQEQQQPSSGNSNNQSTVKRRFNSVRRKSSAFVSSLLQTSFLGPQSASNYEIGNGNNKQSPRPRRLSIYEMTKSPPPETSLEIYLSERRRSSTISSKQVQQQLEQQSTFETNYCQRQQYFKDLNQKLINQDKKLLNVVANRGQIHRHSVDIAQLPLHLAQAKASKANTKLAATKSANTDTNDTTTTTRTKNQPNVATGTLNRLKSRLADHHRSLAAAANAKSKRLTPDAINQSINANNSEQRAEDEPASGEEGEQEEPETVEKLGQQQDTSLRNRLVPSAALYRDRSIVDKRGSVASHGSRRHSGTKKSRIVIRKFQKLDLSQLSSTPAPEVKIGQRVAYKEYYGNEFGTIRWIGRVPQICPDWTAGVEFDNAIGEGDGSLNGRRYFIAKDCFAKFLPLSEVAFVDQHVGRPEPGTMISVMSAAVRPGQMISIQRVSTVHVQHCFLNAPHQIPGADILAVNTRLHCQCPNCGPCAHVIKPPRTQRLARSKKNATHMCQFSTYTCCGMESQEEAMCAYTGNKATSSLPPQSHFGSSSKPPLPPIGNSWIEGAGYLTQLQAQQSKMMPEEYKMGAAPEDAALIDSRRHFQKTSSRRGSGKQKNRKHKQATNNHNNDDDYDDDDSRQVAAAPSAQESFQQSTPAYSPLTPVGDWESVGGLNDGQTFGTTDNKIEGSSNSNEQAIKDENRLQFSGDCLPPSYSPPDPNYVNFNTQQPTFTSPGLAYMKKNVPYVEPVWCETSNPKTTAPKVGSTAKVVYRDSIENRYLFPTDDPIDSALEADLENLSQARYGHSNTNLRLNGSKNIFKSLRSLVSCLSAQSNHSEIMDERRSENTMKFSEFGDRGTSKAAPTGLSFQDPPKQLIDDFFVQSNSPNSREEKYHQVYNNNNNNVISNHSHNNINSDSNARASRHNKLAYSNNNNFTIDNHKQQQQQQHAIMRQISSSSDCGFSSASQNSINFTSPNHLHHHHHQISADEKMKRIQIYNNFLTNLMSSTTMNEEDLTRLRRVLFEPHLDNCCLHGGGNFSQVSFSGEAEQILADGVKKSCMLHEKSYEQVQRISSACCRSNTNYYPANNTIFESSQPNGDCKSRNKRRSLIDGSSSTTSESATLSSYDSFSGTAVICGDNQSISSSKNIVEPKGKSRSLESEKLTNNNNPTVTLPKAFELKLTLSINNNSESKDQSSSKDAVVCGEPSEVSNVLDETNGNLLNSTFNINIVSEKKKDEPDERKIAETEQAEIEGSSTDLNNTAIPDLANQVKRE